MSHVRKIDSIQGLRGIAALLVVIDHAILLFLSTGATHLSEAERSLAHVAETLGRHGVEIFFLISGFVMTVASYGEFEQPGAAPDFLKRRLMRIVPLYWLVTSLVVAGLIWHGRPPDAIDFVKSLAFIPYANETGVVQPLLRRGWTLNYEMFFYTLFAIALLQTPRRGLIGILTCLIGLTVLGDWWVGAEPCSGAACRLATFYTQPIMLYFAGGILLGVLRLYLHPRGLIPRPRFVNGFGLAMALSALYVLYVSWTPPSDATYVVGVIFCVLTAACCALVDDESAGGRLKWLFLMVGEASYSIYMTNSLFIDPISGLWLRVAGRRGLPAYLAVMIVGCIVLGAMTFRYVERPSLKFLRSLRQPRR